MKRIIRKLVNGLANVICFCLWLTESWEIKKLLWPVVIGKDTEPRQ